MDINPAARIDKIRDIGNAALVGDDELTFDAASALLRSLIRAGYHNTDTVPEQVLRLLAMAAMAEAPKRNEPTPFEQLNDDWRR